MQYAVETWTKCLRFENEDAIRASSRAERQLSLTAWEIVVVKEVLAACKLLISFLSQLPIELKYFKTQKLKTQFKCVRVIAL